LSTDFFQYTILPVGITGVANELRWQASSEVANELMASELTWQASSEVANELRGSKRAQSWQASAEVANELRAGEQAQLRVGKKAGVKYNFDT
jgi:hypothetical protein